MTRWDQRGPETSLGTLSIIMAGIRGIPDCVWSLVSLWGLQRVPWLSEPVILPPLEGGSFCSFQALKLPPTGP